MGIRTVIHSQDSQDSQLWVSGSSDKMIKIVNLLQGEVVGELEMGDEGEIKGIISSLVDSNVSYGDFVLCLWYLGAQHIDHPSDA